MAPPTVEFGEKGADRDIKVVFPAASTVEQPPKSTNTKKYKYFAGVVLISVVIIAGVVLGSIALHHHLNPKTEYETESVYNGYHIPEQAHIDYTNKILYVNNSRYNEVMAANNLHDYNRQLLVIKDIDNKVCYIDKLEGTFEEGVTRISRKKVSDPGPVKPVVITSKPLDKRILRKFGGDAIANHCNGLPTFWVLDDERSPKGEIKSTPKIKCIDDETSVLCREKRDTVYVFVCHKGVIVVVVHEAQQEQTAPEMMIAPDVDEKIQNANVIEEGDLVEKLQD